MKLINPTDRQLEVAFAEKVAGWTYWQSKHGHFYVTDPNGKQSEPAYGWPKYDENTGEKIVRHWTDGVDIPPFTRSFDAVLPWLERSAFDVQITFSNTCDTWTVRLLGRFVSNKEFSHTGDSCEPLSRVAVIALLRAHGVEVEFKQ